MPTFLNKNGFRFFVYSNEEDRVHIHVEKREGDAKYWLEPEIECEYSYNFSGADTRFIEQTIRAEHNTLIKKWNGYFKKKGNK